MSIKLTDTQLVLLGAAAQRKDLFLVAPPTLNFASAQKVASKLISLGFVKEVKAKASDPIWVMGRKVRGVLCAQAHRRGRPAKAIAVDDAAEPEDAGEASDALVNRDQELSRQSWTPRRLDPQKRWNLVLEGRLLPAAARAGPLIFGGFERDHGATIAGIDHGDGLARPHDPPRADRPAQARLFSRDRSIRR